MRALHSSRARFDADTARFRVTIFRLHTRTLGTLNTVIGPLHKLNVQQFREQAFYVESPLLITNYTKNSTDGTAESEFPAAKKWFVRTRKGTQTLNHHYLQKFEDIVLPYELVSYSVRDNISIDGDDNVSTMITEENSTSNLKHMEVSSFRRFVAPLQLLVTASQSDTPPQLYIAQSQLDDLPKALRNDVPTPRLVLEAGKGDVYDANLWMGIPPTYTPLHKDPNPNLFAQLSGNKVVRLFPPAVGLAIFQSTQLKIGGQASAAFRGDEMMQGMERRELEKSVWNCSSSTDGYEVIVKPGDALFIPVGWWHSIKSMGSDITASVNWWFR